MDYHYCIEDSVFFGAATDKNQLMDRKSTATKQRISNPSKRGMSISVAAGVIMDNIINLDEYLTADKYHATPLGVVLREY